MPYIKTNLSVALPKEKEMLLKERLGKAISILPGKSESYLMLEFSENCRLYFKGQNSQPIAFVEVKLFGKARQEDYNALTGEICCILEETLDIPPAQVYVKYEEVEHWGWNGSNF